MTYRVVRPDGTVIDCEPGVNMTDALWNAREFDERLERLVQRNRTNNVSGAKKAGYSFAEVQTAKLRPGGYCSVNARGGDTVRIVARREGEFDYVVIPAASEVERAPVL